MAPLACGPTFRTGAAAGAGFDVPQLQRRHGEVRRNEVQLDVCPKCRDVWLDRGELEKLLHSAREVEADYERERASWSRQPPAYQPHRYPSDRGHHGRYNKKRKFSDLFDIFD
jgi:uncharacterized protein